MNPTLWLIILLLKDAAASCDWGWHEFREMCYYVSPINVFENYAGAFNNCDAMGAYLGSVSSRNITDFILQNTLLPNGVGCVDGQECDRNIDFWIGLTKDISGVDIWANITKLRIDWTWQGGQVYEWHSWREGEPAYGEGYVRMRDDGSWGAELTGYLCRYICELEANDSKETPISTTSTLSMTKPMTNTTQSTGQNVDKGPATSIYLYIGPALGVVVAIVIVVIVIVLYRRRRAAKESHQNGMYYNTRGDLNNHTTHNLNKNVNIQADSGNQYAYDNQLPPGHNAPPLQSGPMYAEIDKGGQRNSMQGPPTANKPVDNGRISAMYAQPDLTAKKNRRNVNTAPDEDVTLVENSTYATTLPK